jgi:hypothetical protein
MRQLIASDLRAPLDARGALGWISQGTALLRVALRWGAHHTGLPIVLVAAIVLVASGHLVKRTMRFGVEVALALGLLLAATRLGWIVW